MSTIGTIKVRIDGDTKGLSRDLDVAQKKVSQTTERMERMAAAAKIAATAGVALLSREFVRLSDSVTSATNKLRASTDSQTELNQSFQSLISVARESRSNFEATVELYAKMERSTRDLGLSSDELLQITSDINKSFALSGASAQEASGAIRQLGQALASGALRGDEFNSIAEGAPLILEAVSKSTGMAIGELRDFAAEGKITAEILIQSLQEYSDQINGEFAQTQSTFAQSMENSRTNAIEFVKANDQVIAGTRLLGDTIETLSENIDLIANIALVALIAAMGKYSGAAATAVARNIALAASAKPVRDNFGMVVAQTKSATIATRAYSAAAGVASRAMGFLGGPAGIILTVIGSMIALGGRTTETSDKIKGLGEEAKKAKSEFLELDIAIRNVGKKDISIETIEKLREDTRLAERALQRANRTFEQTQKLFNEGRTDQPLLQAAKDNAERAEARLKQLRETLGQTIRDFETLTGQTIDRQVNEEPPASTLEQFDWETAERAKKLVERHEKEKEQKKILAEDDLAFFQDQYKTREQLELENFDRQQAMLEQHIADGLLTREQAADTLQSIEEAKQQAQMDMAIGGFKNIFGALGKHNKAMLKVSKAFGLAEAGVSIARGIAKAQELGFPANLAEMARVAAVGSQVYSQIKGAQAGAASASTASAGSAAAPIQQAPQQQDPNRIFNIELAGQSAIPREQVRELIGAIGEELNDNVQFNFTGG